MFLQILRSWKWFWRGWVQKPLQMRFQINKNWKTKIMGDSQGQKYVCLAKIVPNGATNQASIVFFIEKCSSRSRRLQNSVRRLENEQLLFEICRLLTLSRPKTSKTRPKSNPKSNKFRSRGQKGPPRTPPKTEMCFNHYLQHFVRVRCDPYTM